MPVINKELLEKLKERSDLPRINMIRIDADITEEEAKELLKKKFRLASTFDKEKGTGSLWVHKYNYDWEENFLIDEEQTGWIKELEDIPKELWEKKKRELKELIPPEK